MNHSCKYLDHALEPDEILRTVRIVQWTQKCVF